MKKICMAIVIVIISMMSFVACSYKQKEATPIRLLSVEDVKNALTQEGLNFTEVPVPSELPKDAVLNKQGPAANLKMDDGLIVSVYVFPTKEEVQKAVDERNTRIGDKAKTIHGVNTTAINANNLLVIFGTYPPSASATKVQTAILNLKAGKLPASAAENLSNEWFVVKKEGQKALLVSAKAKDYSNTGGNKEFFDAVWVSNMPENIGVGQKIKANFVEGESVATYPGQQKVQEVKVIPDTKPSGANKTQEQVIREAIASKEASNIRVFTIKNIAFNQSLHQWTINFEDGLLADQAKEQSMQIADQ